MNTSLKFVFAHLLCIGMAWSQVDDVGWKRVQAIEAGHSIRVHTADKKHDGSFAGASDIAISLTSREGVQLSFPRSEVTRVYIRTKSRRGWNTVIGTAIGAGIGICLYSTFGTYFRNEGQDGTAAMLVAPIGIGAGLGAIVPTGRLTKIYDAKQPRQP